jgi:hypothetical protein
MFPAGQTANAAIMAIIGRKSNPITFSPQHSFREGGFELTMTAQNPTFATDEQKSTIYRPSCPGIKFDKPNCHINACPVSSLAQAMGGKARNFYTIGKVSGNSLMPEWGMDWVGVKEWIAR